ncbi:chromate transporter [Acidisoma cellulosilytica]|uniref:Chromate transporter n=1 Tax=Acidisoma cellulosilyticum TaxID=2802395 RepID=A0A963Z5C6_9PROT|nr:chromate transporter [Acidisoma cellulosilyticum]MCB8882132.1 chromate transporter [Acidisoma cellulosilyticum]
MPNLLAQLAGVFAPLSLVTVGGGQAIVADIQRQIVNSHHWMLPKQFVDAFALSRMAPGPGSLLATLIGWQVAGFWGAVVSTIAIFGPTAILVYGIAHLWSRYKGAVWQQAVEAGLRPIAAGMILASGYGLLHALDGGWVARGIAAGATIILLRRRTNPLILLAVGAVLLTGLQCMGV